MRGLAQDLLQVRCLPWLPPTWRLRLKRGKPRGTQGPQTLLPSALLSQQEEGEGKSITSVEFQVWSHIGLDKGMRRQRLGVQLLGLVLGLGEGLGGKEGCFLRWPLRRA